MEMRDLELRLKRLAKSNEDKGRTSANLSSQQQNDDLGIAPINYRTLMSILSDTHETKKSRRSTLVALAVALSRVFPEHTPDWYLERLMRDEGAMRQTVWAVPPEMYRGTYKAGPVEAFAAGLPSAFVLFRRTSLPFEGPSEPVRYRAEPMIFRPPENGVFPVWMGVKGAGDDKDSIFSGHAFINERTLNVFLAASNTKFGAVFRHLAFWHPNDKDTRVYSGMLVRQRSGGGAPICLAAVMAALPTSNREVVDGDPTQLLLDLLDRWSPPSFDAGRALSERQRLALAGGYVLERMDDLLALFRTVPTLP